MDYRAALEFFRDRSDYDRGFISNPFAGDEAAAAGLRRTRLLVDALGSPDRAYPIIHVAGTKGKGSTCAFIESVVRQAGMRTGLFVTPHLHTVRERIQIDAEPVSEESWASATELVARHVTDVETKHPQLGRITAFEFNTALALYIFEQATVDLAIVEVGLGGRLDATNIVRPVVSVITAISFDHEAILGDSLPEIALEKAGIIKAGVPVVVAPQDVLALTEIRERAKELGSPIFVAGTDWRTSYGDGLSTFIGPWGSIGNVQLGLRGGHQSQNAGTALMSLHIISRSFFNDSSVVTEALKSTRWPGRFETINHTPAVIVDGAHNGASMNALVDALAEEYPTSEFIVVFGSYRDKNLAEMLSELQKLDPKIVATRSASPRARSASSVRDAAKTLGMTVIEQGSVTGAIRLALDTAETETIIVATGSLSVVAEVREYFGLARVSDDERALLSG